MLTWAPWRAGHPLVQNRFRRCPPSTMNKPPTHRFDTLSLHAGAVPDPVDRRARDADLPDGVVRLSRHRSRGGALQHGARRARLFAHLQSDLRGARGAHRRARRRRGRDRDRQRAGGAASGDRHAARRGLAHRRIALAVRRLAQSSRLHAAALRRDDDVRRSRATSTRGAARSGRETRLLFGETLGNPGLDVLDIPRVAALAHEHGLPLLVDSTFTTPWLMQPFEHGADLVFHSATKFLSGHGVVIGGLLVDAGRFDWDGARSRGKFPTLTEPYRGFHDMVFAEESTTAAFLLRARREGVRDFGACMAPFTAFQILQGIETLPLRMAKHVENTRRIVAFLRDASVRRLGRLSGAARASGSRAGRAVAAARLRRGVQLRDQRDARAGSPVHRDAQALLAPGQRRRCAARW